MEKKKRFLGNELHVLCMRADVQVYRTLQLDGVRFYKIMATDVVIEIRLCSTFRTAPRTSPHGARCGVLVLERAESHPTAQHGPDTVT